MEQNTYRIFLTCMVATASLAIIGFWFESTLPEYYFKFVATGFIIGLGNFLAWATIITYRFLDK